MYLRNQEKKEEEAKLAEMGMSGPLSKRKDKSMDTKAGKEIQMLQVGSVKLQNDVKAQEEEEIKIETSIAQESFNFTKLGSLFKKEIKVKNVPNPTKYEILYNYFGLAGIKLEINEDKQSKKNEIKGIELYAKQRQKMY